MRDHVRDDVRDDFREPLCLSAFQPSDVRDGEIFRKTRSINMSIYSQGRERFIPNVGTFHSQAGNKRYVIVVSFFSRNYLAE